MNKEQQIQVHLRTISTLIHENEEAKIKILELNNNIQRLNNQIQTLKEDQKYFGRMNEMVKERDAKILSMDPNYSPMKEFRQPR